MTEGQIVDNVKHHQKLLLVAVLTPWDLNPLILIVRGNGLRMVCFF